MLQSLLNFSLFFSLFFLHLQSTALALPDRARCNARDLERQDCRLQARSWKFQLSNKTISWTDGVWSTVDDIPLSGPGLTWEKIQLKVFNKRYIVQLWIWGAGVGEGNVQTLHWIILEFADKKMNLISQKPVRKRHLEVTTGNDTAKDKLSHKPKYIYDPTDAHGLSEGKNGRLKWTLLKATTEF